MHHIGICFELGISFGYGFGLDNDTAQAHTHTFSIRGYVFTERAILCFCALGHEHKELTVVPCRRQAEQRASLQGAMKVIKKIKAN